MPLRHIGIIVIWEGNYNSDTFNIGRGDHFLNENQQPRLKAKPAQLTVENTVGSTPRRLILGFQFIRKGIDSQFCSFTFIFFN